MGAILEWHDILDTISRARYRICTQYIVLVPCLFQKGGVGPGLQPKRRISPRVSQKVNESGYRATVVVLLEKHAHRKSQIEVDPFERWTNPRGSLRVRQK